MLKEIMCEIGQKSVTCTNYSIRDPILNTQCKLLEQFMRSCDFDKFDDFEELISTIHSCGI